MESPTYVQWCREWSVRDGHAVGLSKAHMTDPAAPWKTRCGRIAGRPALRWNLNEEEAREEGVCARCATK